ncbi:hypothetical protein A6J66_017535 [Yersinia enterocolitica]|nr:hypothetical protein A6J66_017535 [Yersinia enterocolitica]
MPGAFCIYACYFSDHRCVDCLIFIGRAACIFRIDIIKTFLFFNCAGSFWHAQYQVNQFS